MCYTIKKGCWCNQGDERATCFSRDCSSQWQSFQRPWLKSPEKQSRFLHGQRLAWAVLPNKQKGSDKAFSWLITPHHERSSLNQVWRITFASIQKGVGKVLFWLVRLKNTPPPALFSFFFPSFFLSTKPTLFFFMNTKFLHKHFQNGIWRLKTEGWIFVLPPPLSAVTLEVYKPCSSRIQACGTKCPTVGSTLTQLKNSCYHTFSMAFATILSDSLFIRCKYSIQCKEHNTDETTVFTRNSMYYHVNTHLKPILEKHFKIPLHQCILKIALLLKKYKRKYKIQKYESSWCAPNMLAWNILPK